MIKNIFFAFMLLLFFSGCSQTTNKQTSTENINTATTVSDTFTVNVYYFHGKQRCKTCIAVENVAKKVVSEHYKDNMKVKFWEINIDEDKNKDIVEKHQIAYSSLLIVKGESKTDITEQAFGNAVNSPDVLAKLIKEEVNKRIN